MSYDASAVRQTLVKLYDLEELRTLCMDLNVDYDSLRGEGKAAKARELVLYMEWLRSGFPRRKLAHVGPAAWAVVDLR